MAEKPCAPTATATLGSPACSRHGTAYNDHCRECDHVLVPVPYDPVPDWIWRMVGELRQTGWIVCEPGNIPMPRNLDEAKKMNVLAEAFIWSNLP